MVVINAKPTKKRAVILVVIIAVILVGIILLAGRCSRGNNSDGSNAVSLKAQTNEDPVRFLSAYGWEVESEALEFQPVTIPVVFGDVYTGYNELQALQGFDLTKYAGCEATRYTYKITNYPETGVAAVADIIVYNGKVIAGDVQSPAIDGFMTTLKG